MGFSIRFGGWRPVQLEEGVGTLHGSGVPALKGVAYRFEVWHQMVDGFPGPFRSEGWIRARSEGAGELAAHQGKRVELELEDGRRLPLRLRDDGSLLAHTRPQAPSEAV